MNQTLPERAMTLAGRLLLEADHSQTHSEKVLARKMSRLMNDPEGKTMALALTDQVFRPRTPARSAKLFRDLIRRHGVPVYLPLQERVAMALGAAVSRIAPGWIMKAVTAKMRAESAAVILPSENAALRPILRRRLQEGSRMNVNQLGEAILGEEEAARRLADVVARLERPDCDYVSVKVSAIFSQINLVAYDATIAAIQDRLRVLYRVAAASHPRKFVNLDMEEYRDLHITVDSFRRTLDEAEFRDLSAGIVLQAYLPDSFAVQQDLTRWACDRVSSGGSPIKIRIVKGANLAMEKVDASLHGWPLATYGDKLDVDANYKRMLEFGMRPEHAAAVRLGVASHNLFDISHALLLRSDRKVTDFVEMEMLEGMAEHQARIVLREARGLLRYAPVVRREDFHSAISYLIRRLDENTHEENFLHDLFDMEPGSAAWDRQKALFLAACDRQNQVSTTPNRRQNRATETFSSDPQLPFDNAPDTDWSLRENRNWIQKDLAAAPGEPPPPWAREEVEILAALERARQAQPAWEARADRSALLHAVAAEMARSRGDSVAVMVRDAHKAISEADVEVSEAIDFARYYAGGLDRDGMRDGTEFHALGVVVVTPPWNFPFAIPCGGILAALMAGNTVILKPAPQTVLTAWVMVCQLWKAGIPEDALQFLPCPDNEIGKLLVTSADAVILTGAYETARLFQSWKPDIRLHAETSGKNALVITSAADPDQAIRDLVKSAFGHAGQKCSAASLAILEADVYDDPAFHRQLRDAAASLTVGPATNPASVVTPLIMEPEPNLLKALTTLQEGETWLLEPKMIDNNPRLWSPGIRLGVKRGGWFHKTECFGPVLGLIRAENLADAIDIQNDSDFALTGGIHSLDADEIRLWRENVQVGNAYINRPITGAIVRRQPFGGWKKSCFGPGAKAGGPNHVAMFGVWEEKKSPTLLSPPAPDIEALLDRLPGNRETLDAAAASYTHWWHREFSLEHDPSALHGESNHFRYVPLSRVLVRADSLNDEELALVHLAAATARAPLEISLSAPRPWLRDNPSFPTILETEEQLLSRLRKGRVDASALRAPDATPALQEAANLASLPLNRQRPLSNGRLELTFYLREQSISECRHRYGNIVR